MPSASQLTALLRRLTEAEVRFVLVGGLAAVAQGAPIMTRDVDVVHARDEANLDALMRVLVALHAVYRGRPGAPLQPKREHLAGLGHHLLKTDLGPLDVLGAIHGGRDYDALLLESVELPLPFGTIRVLSLESIVRDKRSSTEEKDRLMVPILESTLRRGG